VWDIHALSTGKLLPTFQSNEATSSSGSSSLTSPKIRIFISAAIITSNIAQEFSSFLCDKKKKKADTIVVHLSLQTDQGRRERTLTPVNFFSGPPASADGLKIFTVNRNRDLGWV